MQIVKTHMYTRCKNVTSQPKGIGKKKKKEKKTPNNWIVKKQVAALVWCKKKNSSRKKKELNINLESVVVEAIFFVAVRLADTDDGNW